MDPITLWFLDYFFIFLSIALTFITPVLMFITLIVIFINQNSKDNEHAKKNILRACLMYLEVLLINYIMTLLVTEIVHRNWLLVS